MNFVHSVYVQYVDSKLVFDDEFISVLDGRLAIQLAIYFMQTGKNVTRATQLMHICSLSSQK